MTSATQKDSTTLNIAVIGCGYWGPNLIRNLAESPKVKLTHICDLDRDVLDQLQRRYPYVKTTTDYQSLLDNRDIDAVVIATPVNTHYKIAKAALENGKHVQIEKPLASTVAEGEILTRLANENGLTLLVDHTFVYSGAVQVLKTHMQEVGEMRYFDSVRVNLGLFQKDINVIWDLAPHDLSILIYLTDQDPEELMAVGSAHLHGSIENTAYLIAKFKNNFMAHFHFNWLSPVKVRQTLIGGSKKMIAYNDLDPIEPVKVYDYGVNSNLDKNAIMVNYRTGDVISPRVDKTEALKHVCDDFVNSIREGRKPISDGAFGVRVLRLLEAADLSLKSNNQFIKLH